MLYEVITTEIIGKLFLQHPVNTTHFLFLTQLNAVSDGLGAMAAAMLSGREIPFFHCAGVPVAAISLQEKLLSFPRITSYNVCYTKLLRLK